jgi:hypothetical protein
MQDEAASAGQGWPPQLPVFQLRVARRVTRLEAMVEFYHHGVGLPVIFQYQGHDSYDGVIFGLPGRAYNLELVSRQGAGPRPTPDPDDLLVLYLAGQAARDAVVGRLAAMGRAPVTPRNPYWARQGVTIPDPEGWRVVLTHSPGFGPEFDAGIHS